MSCTERARSKDNIRFSLTSHFAEHFNSFSFTFPVSFGGFFTTNKKGVEKITDYSLDLRLRRVMCNDSTHKRVLLA